MGKTFDMVKEKYDEAQSTPEYHDNALVTMKLATTLLSIVTEMAIIIDQQGEQIRNLDRQDD